VLTLIIVRLVAEQQGGVLDAMTSLDSNVANPAPVLQEYNEDVTKLRGARLASTLCRSIDSHQSRAAFDWQGQ
jgi:hypothetical protein